MRAQILRFTLVIFATCILAGCTSTKDVTNDIRFAGALKPSASFYLLKPVFVYDYNVGRLFFDKYPVAPGFWLLPEGFNRYVSTMVTPTVSEYLAIKKAKGIEGVVPSGATLAFVRVIYYNYFEGETSFYVFRIADGSFAGREVCINELMLETPNRLTRSLNTVFLQEK